MRIHFQRQKRYFLLGLVLLAVVWPFSGCAHFDFLQGQAFQELEENWSEGFRPLSEPGQQSGLSTKARQVERNLGIQ